MRRYKYESAQQWLQQKIAQANLEDLRSIAVSLASELDEDRIQDLFQDEMEADGFFEELPEDK